MILALIVSLAVSAVQSDCARTSIGLAQSDYVRAAAQTTAGLAAKAGIVRRDATGQPSATGKGGFLMLGMSNAKLVGDRFRGFYHHDPQRVPWMTFISGAVNGQTASDWADPTDPAWADAAQEVKYRGFTAPQIQAVALVLTQKEPLRNGAMTEAHVRAIVANVKDKYPNVAVVTLSGINYTGYSDDPQNRAPEPFIHNDSILLASLARTGGFPVWVDFVDWWADGVTANPFTGLSYVCADLKLDGVHPSEQGQDKIAVNLLGRWKLDPVFAGWMFQ